VKQLGCDQERRTVIVEFTNDEMRHFQGFFKNAELVESLYKIDEEDLRRLHQLLGVVLEIKQE
jgi:hypothetical protein